MLERALTTYIGVVYPWHCDHVGHMNVASYVRKFDEATWQLFTKIGMDGAYFRGRMGGMAAVEQNITYSRELQAGDCVRVVSSILNLKRRTITFRHDMTEVVSGEGAASCTITAVHIDPEERRASLFPDSVFERAASLLADEVSD